VGSDEFRRIAKSVNKLDLVFVDFSALILRG